MAENLTGKPVTGREVFCPLRGCGGHEDAGRDAHDLLLDHGIGKMGAEAWEEIMRLREHIAGLEHGAVTEHAIQMSGGGYHVRNSDPEIEKIYPLAKWIVHRQRFGGKVYRRRVIVVEDWGEVPADAATPGT